MGDIRLSLTYGFSYRPASGQDFVGTVNRYVAPGDLAEKSLVMRPGLQSVLDADRTINSAFSAEGLFQDAAFLHVGNCIYQWRGSEEAPEVVIPDVDSNGDHAWAYSAGVSNTDATGITSTGFRYLWHSNHQSLFVWTDDLALRQRNVEQAQQGLTSGAAASFSWEFTNEQLESIVLPIGLRFVIVTNVAGGVWYRLDPSIQEIIYDEYRPATPVVANRITQANPPVDPPGGNTVAIRWGSLRPTGTGPMLSAYHIYGIPSFAVDDPGNTTLTVSDTLRTLLDRFTEALETSPVVSGSYERVQDPMTNAVTGGRYTIRSRYVGAAGNAIELTDLLLYLVNAPVDTPVTETPGFTLGSPRIGEDTQGNLMRGFVDSIKSPFLEQSYTSQGFPGGNLSGGTDPSSIPDAYDPNAPLTWSQGYVQVPLPDNSIPGDIAEIGSFIVVAVRGADRMYFVRPGEITIQPEDFFSAEHSGDPILHLRTQGDLLYVFSTDSVEIWRLTGGLFPFTRVGGITVPFGVRKDTVQLVKDTFVFASTDAVVYQLRGTSLSQPLSNPSVSSILRGEGLDAVGVIDSSVEVPGLVAPPEPMRIFDLDVFTEVEILEPMRIFDLDVFTEVEILQLMMIFDLDVFTEVEIAEPMRIFDLDVFTEIEISAGPEPMMIFDLDVFSEIDIT